MFFLYNFMLVTTSLLCSFNGTSVLSHVMCAVVRFESYVTEKTIKTVVLLAVSDVKLEVCWRKDQRVFWSSP
jgi:hypothetical protein